MTNKRLGGPDSVVGRQMAEKTRQRRRELLARTQDAMPDGPAYGIIDPDYARIFTIARKLAWDEGYALAMHGSFTRDLDLIAVPWTEKACDPEHLVKQIEAATGTKQNGHPPGDKPHGRRAWTLLLPAFGDPRFVDLSIMPRCPQRWPLPMRWSRRCATSTWPRATAQKKIRPPGLTCCER